MNERKTLLEAFKQADYPLTGHGKRDVQVLKNALDAVDGSLESDHYGSGQVIEDYQNRMADYLGKEAAVFFPSGTMAQQIALRIWCDRNQLKRVAYHPLCHLEIHEEHGLQELHRIESVLLADKDRVITLEDVQQMPEDIACLLLELPQREIGGQLPDYEELEAISAYCRNQGIKLHMDGARLLEVTPYYGKSAAEISKLFDSVYISVYKGIGGVAGAILAGDRDVMEESKVWKRRHGGDLISLYPYILSADYYFNQHEHQMQRYYREAVELAALYNECHGVTTLPEVPVSNMFHVHIHVPKEKLEPVLLEIYAATGVGLTSYLSTEEGASSPCRYEVTIGDRYAGVPTEVIQQALRMLDERLRTLK
ncbi:beta-eliminating lyase-related protein [Paenibacillus sp. P96]|uniref:Beta-eliminating lyase-related protein n=1 Tax=Paenibacillus zeirhizosphaerae TaxID=2987519 RepID=A0ABT9FXQ7_9BACL|nr:beta-eliminating lyase-related protein [Paenibacillus sp. P96]MDP4099425.1 beta-eliminating lyase-related protein [Paenibacillus sp. P96]